jgi:hypothetical protein
MKDFQETLFGSALDLAVVKNNVVCNQVGVPTVLLSCFNNSDTVIRRSMVRRLMLLAEERQTITSVVPAAISDWVGKNRVFEFISAKNKAILSAVLTRVGPC